MKVIRSGVKHKRNATDHNKGEYQNKEQMVQIETREQNAWCKYNYIM